MSRTFIGDLCAHIKPAHTAEKSKYIRIGAAFKDENGRVSLKIDTIPLSQTNWEGWCNVMERKAFEPPAKPPVEDTDIPF
jgi:hypothetical protein